MGILRVSVKLDGLRSSSGAVPMLNGEEWEQPADLVLLCAYGLFNVRLMLLSNIGKPYDYTKVTRQDYARHVLVATLLSTPAARAIYVRLGRWIERLIGTLLVGFGFRLIYDRS